MLRCSWSDRSRPDRWTYCNVVVVLRWPANRAMVCSSHPHRARSVRQRCRNVCVLKRGMSARRASARTTLDQVQMLIGSPCCAATPTETARHERRSRCDGGRGRRAAALPRLPSMGPHARGGSSWSPRECGGSDGQDRCRRSAGGRVLPDAGRRRRRVQSSNDSGSARRERRAVAFATARRWGSRELREARDQALGALGAERLARRVAAATDGIGLAPPLFDQVVIEEAHGDKTLLEGGIGKADTRVDGDNVVAALMWPRRQVADVAARCRPGWRQEARCLGGCRR